MHSYSKYRPPSQSAHCEPMNVSRVMNPGSEQTSPYRGFPSQPSYWQAGSNPPLSSIQPPPPSGLFKGPSIRTQISLDYETSDQAFLVGTSGSAHLTHFNQTTSGTHPGHANDNPRSRPLPIPTALATTLPHYQPVTDPPKISNTFETARIPNSVGLGTSRPLPAAPFNSPARRDTYPDRTSSVVTAANQIQVPSVRDRILALQQQAGAQASPQRRALPKSPTAPPDLSQLPSVLRRRGTLPEPPNSNSHGSRSAVSVPNSHRHTQSLSSDLVPAVPTHNTLLRHQPDTLNSHETSVSDFHVEFEERTHRTEPHHESLGDDNVEHRDLGTVVPEKQSESNDKSIPDASTSRSSFNEFRLTTSSAPPDSSTQFRASDQRKSPLARTSSEPKPIQGGPRRMHSNKQTDNTPPSNQPQATRITSTPRGTQQRNLTKGSQSLTFRLAAMSLEEENGTHSKPVAIFFARSRSCAEYLCRPTAMMNWKIRLLDHSDLSAPSSHRADQTHMLPNSRGKRSQRKILNLAMEKQLRQRVPRSQKSLLASMMVMGVQKQLRHRAAERPPKRRSGRKAK
jgi:hypothetical protein